MIGDKPNGTNINAGYGAVSPQRLQEAVLTQRADVGVALDGDADRSIFVDEQGAAISGDHVMAAFAFDLLERDRLNHKTVVGTVMSNFGFELALKNAGISLIRTPVGDRYVLEQMLAGGYNLGGEQSGHIIFLDFNTTGDGIISAIQMLKLMKRCQRPVSEITNCMSSIPQVLLGVQVKERRDLAALPELQRAIQSCETQLNGRGRVLIRYSGTEPLVRIMVEGQDDAAIRQMADELVGVVKSAIG